MSRRSCFRALDWLWGRRPPTRAASEAHAALERFEYDEARDRREYAAVCREAMRALAAAVLPDAVVQKSTEASYHVRTSDGAFEFRWADSGVKRFWNAYLYVDGAERWSASVIDAAQAEGGRVRLEICYDRDVVRTEDIARAVRCYPEGKDVRLFTAGEDVGQQSGLTLEMLHDVPKTAVERRRGGRAAAPAPEPWWALLWPW